MMIGFSLLVEKKGVNLTVPATLALVFAPAMLVLVPATLAPATLALAPDTLALIVGIK
jgi:hypothetical protein